mmetsp:Transcript_6407/g.22893  ORF Transcript_6407/g.22893 Transcript_6407/m.22893 type:complete len:286 (-) Transcript_6407:61-918(-)
MLRPVHSVCDDLGLRIASREHNDAGIWVILDRSQANGDHMLLPRILDSSEVARRGGCRLVIQLCQPRCRVVVLSFAVERHVAVRPYPTKEESDAPQAPDLLLVLAAILVHGGESGSLIPLQSCHGLPLRHCEVNAVGEEVPIVHLSLAAQSPDVHHPDLCRIQAEVLCVLFLHIRREAVLVARVDGEELVHLEKVQARHVRPACRVQQPQTAQLLDGLPGPPSVQEVLHPPDKVLWGSAGGQGDYPARVGLHPLYEPRGHDLAELRKVFYLDDGQLFLWVLELPL